VIHGLRGAIWLIGAVALPLVALVLLLSLVDDSIDALDAPPSAMSVPTETAPLDLSIEAVVVVEFGDEIMIRAPENWNGLVTSVDVAPGQDVVSGSPVLNINGVRRLAIHSPAPFYRSLALRDKGPDVAMLQEVLRDLRVFEGESDGLYGSETERAVNVLSKMLGADNKVFDPSWFVWLPAASVTVGRVDIQVGDSAPVSGAPLLITERSVVRIAIEAPTNPVPVISGFPSTLRTRGLPMSIGSRIAGQSWILTTRSDRRSSWILGVPKIFLFLRAG